VTIGVMFKKPQYLLVALKMANFHWYGDFEKILIFKKKILSKRNFLIFHYSIPKIQDLEMQILFWKEFFCLFCVKILFRIKKKKLFFRLHNVFLFGK